MKPNIYVGYASIPVKFGFEIEALTPIQQKRFNTEIVNSSDKRKQQYCASRLLLNQMCKQHFICSDLQADEPLVFPYCLIGRNKSRHNINISHSNNWIAVAIADHAIASNVGVDIQTFKSGWTHDKARFFCSEKQVKQGFEQTFEQAKIDHFFSQLWCQKEAFYKATKKRFTEKGFEGDDFLSTRCIHKDENSEQASAPPVFLSLYCESQYQAHFQQHKLLSS